MSLKSTTKVRVIYADTDAMGIVYHTNYIKWFEIGRAELLRELSIPYAEIERSGYNLPLTEVSCRYLNPARYDQLVVIETIIEYVRSASIKFIYTIWDDKLEKILAEGNSVHACVNNQGRVVRFPAIIRYAINQVR